METDALYNLIHQYRAENGLQEIIPRSRALDYVAQTHVQDLDSFATELTHSWSNCFYDPNDQETLHCMWDAPKRLTSYQGNGYEIAAGSQDGTIALLSVSENHAQSNTLKANLIKGLSGKLLRETQKRSSRGKTPVTSEFEHLRSPSLTEERYGT